MGNSFSAMTSVNLAQRNVRLVSTLNISLFSPFRLSDRCRENISSSVRRWDSPLWWSLGSGPSSSSTTTTWPPPCSPSSPSKPRRGGQREFSKYFWFYISAVIESFWGYCLQYNSLNKKWMDTILNSRENTPF